MTPKVFHFRFKIPTFNYNQRLLKMSDCPLADALVC